MSNSINPFAPPSETETAFVVRSANYRELAGTETGLKITYYGILLMLLSIIGMSVLAQFFSPAIYVGAAIIFLGWIMLIVGPFFCLSAPAETGARGAIMASIGCQVLALLTMVAPFVGLSLGALGNSIGSLMGTIGTVLFIIFLMKIAIYVDRPDLHAKGRTILILSAILIGTLITVAVGSDVIGEAAGFVMMGVAIGMLIAFVMYANLISYLFKAIASLRAQNA